MSHYDWHVKGVAFTKVIAFIVSVLSFVFLTTNACADAYYYDFLISGTFTTSSCTVSTESLYFNFYINDTDLVAANSSTEWQQGPGQVIKLTNCFAGTNSVEASISGVMDDVDKDGFKNQSAANTVATEVSIQLKSGNQTLHDGDRLTTSMTRTDGAIDIPLAARLYSTHGNATAGDVYSAINLTLNYK